MKKATCIIAVVVALICTTKVFAQTDTHDNPLEYLKRVIPRGLPFETWGDMNNCLISTFWKSKTSSDEVSKEIAASVKKKDIVCTYVFRDTMTEFIFSKDSLTMTYNLWFKMKEGLSNDIEYQLGSWNSVTDLWMTKCMVAYEKAKVDSLNDFVLHANVVAHMMKMDLWIPHKITSSLSYDMQYGGTEYVHNFIEIMHKNGLIVSYAENRKIQFMTIGNSYRNYVIVEKGIFEPTFEVTPKWK